VWESLGASDADWAVLTDPARRGGGWGPALEEFYASGRQEVAAVLAALPAEPPLARDRAMDWGSGTGRLTFALAHKFGQVTAVDVSDSMLTTLTLRAAERGLSGVHPVRVDQLRPAADQDLVLSLLVLQHLPDVAAVRAALSTMVACLRHGGVLVVEVPEQALTWRARLQPRFRAYRALRAVGLPPARLHRWGLSGISMLTVDRSAVTVALERAGAHVLQMTATELAQDYRYVRYLARRTV
jgi:SAM-dependent methyltransferase